MSRRLFVVLALLGLGSVPAFAAPVSVNPLDWNLPSYGTHCSMGTDAEGNYLQINTNHPSYSSQILQSIIFEQAVSKVVFTGKIKTESVERGLQSNNCARAQAVFLNDQGEQVGGWPSATNISSVQPWSPFSQELTPPPDGKALRLMLGFYLSTGTADYRDLDVQAFDQAGQPVNWKLAGPEKTDTAGWWPWPFPAEDKTRPIVYDFSPWLRKPDDTRTLGIKGDKFVWSDGKEARFWGTNVVEGGSRLLACSHDEIDTLVDFYVRQGCNLFRLHQFDVGPTGGLFVPSADNTSTFDPEQLDRFDYIVAAAKRAGVSVLFDLLDVRKFRAGDGVTDYTTLGIGAKIVGEYDPKVIELEKDYARKILSHVNPYTKLALKDDPNLVMLNIINESTLFSSHTYGQIPVSYRKELGTMFDSWCQAQTPPVPRPPGEIAQLLLQGDATVTRFLDATQSAYFQEMASVLRDELKIKVPILGSNHAENHVGDVASNSRLGFLDRHAYWDHPQGGWSERDTFDDRPMVRALLKPDSMVESIATQRVAHHPFTVTEWNSCWPNEYIAEAPLLMAAYGSLQGWNALLSFTIDVRTASRSARMAVPFDNGNRPHFMTAFSAAALMYLRGDIATGTPFEVPLDMSNALNPAGEKITATRVLENQVGSVLPEDGGVSLKAAPNEVATTPDVIRSFGGQLEWHADGWVRINTPKSQGYIGFAGGKPIETTDCTMNVVTPFADVLLISLDDLPLSRSRHFVVVATARAENTGEVYRPFKKGLVSSGKNPVLIEPVHASILLRQARKSAPSATPSTLGQFVVDRYGRRGAPVSIAKQVNGGISIDLGSAPGLAFEIALD